MLQFSTPYHIVWYNFFSNIYGKKPTPKCFLRYCGDGGQGKAVNFTLVVCHNYMYRKLSVISILTINEEKIVVNTLRGGIKLLLEYI